MSGDRQQRSILFGFATARTCLCALADRAHSLEASAAYREVVATLDATCGIRIDEILGDPVGRVPGVEIDPRAHERTIYVFATLAIERLGSLGADELMVELMLAMLVDAHELDLAR